MNTTLRNILSSGINNYMPPIRQTSMISRTGTGVKNGIALTNPISFKDSGARVEILGQTFTNLITDGDFSTLDNWTNIAGTTELSTAKYHSSPNSLKCTASGSGAYVKQIKTHIVGHIYFMSYWYYVDSYTSGSIFAEIGGTYETIESPVVGAWTYHSFVNDPMPNNPELNNQYIGALSGTMVAYFDDFEAIDLTAHYGAGNEPTAAQMDLIAPTWFDGTVNVVNPVVKTTTADGFTPYAENSLALTGTLRSVVDAAILYQDRLYNNFGNWYVDRYVNPADGLKQVMATENATVTGVPYVYRDGTTMIETSVIAPVVDTQIPYSAMY